MEEFVSSCHNLGTLMGITKLTDKQLQTVAEYSVKEKITEIQKTELNRLINKRDNPEMMDGAKTLLRDYYAFKIGLDKEKLFTKEIQKGIIMEDESISLLDSVVFGFQGLQKNTIKKNNKIIKGICDVETNDFVIDLKTPWNSKSFYGKAIEEVTVDQIWQLKGYAWLYNKPKALLVFALVNTPTWAYLKGSFDGRPFESIEYESTYNHIEETKKIISYEISIEKTDAKQIEAGVLRARDYLKWYDSFINEKLGSVIAL